MVTTAENQSWTGRTRAFAKRRAFTVIEASFSLFTIVVAMGLFASTMTQFASGQEFLERRAQACLIAEAVLNEMRAGRTHDPEDWRRRHPTAVIHLERSDGAGDWSGYDRLSVEVHVLREGRTPAKVRVSCYLPRTSGLGSAP